MQKEKRRPTLDELKAMPLDLLHMEIAQLCLDAGLADNADVLREAEHLMLDPAPSPEFIVELWNQLRASGSNSTGAEPFIERLEPERPE